MTCIKTGAVVFFENYGYTVPADIYEINNAYIIRWNVNGRAWHPDGAVKCTHVVTYWTCEAVWHREDIGITVCPIHHLHINEEYRDEE